MNPRALLVPKPHPKRPATPPPRAARIPVAQRRRDPEDPIHTEYQERMLTALYSPYAGHFHLAMEIYEIASEEASKPSANVAWTWLVDDQKKEEYHVYMQLLSLPRILLRSLIMNTLPYDSIHDPKVRVSVERYMRVTDKPGIYCQALATNKHDMHPGPETGKGWSRDQVEELCKDIDLYLESSPRGDQFGLLVDKHIPTGNGRHAGPAADPNDRRYCVNSRRAEQRKTLEEWRNLLRLQQSFDNTARDDGAEFSKRSRMEVGWSIDQEERLAQHVDNGHTTHLWGLGQALSRMNWPSDYKHPYQWSLFLVWDRDQQLAQLSEHLGSVLCSAYSWEGEFNCTEAGTISFEDNAKAHESAPSWDANGTEIVITRTRTMRRLRSDLEELNELNALLKELPAREAALKEKEKVVRKLQAREAEALKKYYEIIAETERMKEELAEAKRVKAERDLLAEKRKAALARAREHLAKVQKAKGIVAPVESSSSRIPETPYSHTDDVAPVASNSVPPAREPSPVDDFNGSLTNVTTDASSQPSSPLPPRLF